jgi:hypothetical protein
MLALLERLRDLRRSGAPVEVFFFDDRNRRKTSSMNATSSLSGNKRANSCSVAAKKQ